jgi:phage baseplate assembly protein W
MNRQTGLSLSEAEHIRQSVRDILVTPIGSRVMRRDYGSLLAAMIDRPQSRRCACKSWPPVIPPSRNGSRE